MGKVDLKYKTTRISFIQNYFLAILVIILLLLLISFLNFQAWWSNLVILGIFSLIFFLIFEPEAERVLREYIVTADEITKVEGILTKKRISIPYQSVADVRYFKGITGRIFNFGDVIIKGIKDDIIIKGVKKPEVIYNLIKTKVSRIKEEKKE